MTANANEERQTLTIQLLDGKKRTLAGPDVELELHIDGKRQQRIVKKTEKPVRLKFPPGHETMVVAKVAGHEPQSIMVGPDASHHNFTFKGAGKPIVLMVATKDCEAAAVRAICDHYGKPTSTATDSNVYRIGQFLVGEERAIRKVLMVTSGQGNQAAGAVTTQALISFPDIEHIILVGIAGACPNPAKPSEHVRLGDIVDVDHRGIVQYDNVKESPKTVQYRSHPQKPSARMLQSATDLDAEAELGKRPWEKWIALGTERYTGAARPRDESDVLHEGKEVIGHPVDPKRRSSHPRVHRGAIASADTLQKNPAERDMLRDKWDVRAIEMEGSGFQNAAWMQGKDAMIVRGICDYCDPFKNDDWQPYASLVAAAYARAMIETLPDEWFP
jgi:nucleoside phosphorylase